MKKRYKEAIRLFNQGYSPDQIAEELEISMATAFQWIDLHKTSIALAGIDEEDTEDEFDEVDIEEYEDDPEEASTLGKVAAVMEKDQRSLLIHLKRDSLKAFQELIREGVQPHISGSRWKRKEFSHVIGKCSYLLSMIEEICELDDMINPGELTIHAVTFIISEQFKEYLSAMSEGGTVSWDAPKKELLETAMEVAEFEDDSVTIDGFFRNQAKTYFNQLVETILAVENDKLEIEEIDQLLGEIDSITDHLENLDEEIFDEFHRELEVLVETKDQLLQYRQYQIKSFWGVKLELSGKLKDKINAIESGEIEQEMEVQDE
jgi:predicted transcriptional regulator